MNFSFSLLLTTLAQVAARSNFNCAHYHSLGVLPYSIFRDKRNWQIQFSSSSMRRNIHRILCDPTANWNINSSIAEHGCRIVCSGSSHACPAQNDNNNIRKTPPTKNSNELASQMTKLTLPWMCVFILLPVAGDAGVVSLAEECAFRQMLWATTEYGRHQHTYRVRICNNDAVMAYHTRCAIYSTRFLLGITGAFRAK